MRYDAAIYDQRFCLMSSFIVRKQIKFIIVPYLMKAVMVLITMTCRVRNHNRPVYDGLVESNNSFVLSMWHNCSTIAGWVMRGGNVTVMVSDSRDGEYVSRLANLFGIQTMRGSTSSGSAKAIRAALRLISNNKPIAITLDGPRGPKYKMQHGALWFAASGKVPIVPMHIEASRQWVLKSWDDHRFPKPFSTIHVSFGEPIFVERSDLENDIENVALEVEDKMMANVRRVQAACLGG